MSAPLPDWLEVTEGDAPLILSFPHTGTLIPPEVAAVLADGDLARRDTDWWVNDLYAFAAAELGATLVRSRLSRTVIDLNRDPSGVSLYPGQTTTGLCPTETFDGLPLYRPGHEPDAAEIARRRAAYFEPYHAALSGQIARLKARHGRVVLYDCHSIRSLVPRLFEGELPVFNIGTNSGASCSPDVAAAVTDVCAASRFSHVVNGRFKGGWITRHYGMPADGVEAVQMELACRGYMEETPDLIPPPFNPARAAPIQADLRTILSALLAAVAS
jgi:formiminoglutamase